MEGFKYLKYWITHEFYRAQFILLEPQRCLPPPTPSSPTLLDQELSEEKNVSKGVCLDRNRSSYAPTSIVLR